MNRRSFLGALVGFTTGAAVGSIVLPLTEAPEPKTLTLKCAVPPPKPTPYYQGPSGLDRQQHIALEGQYWEWNTYTGLGHLHHWRRAR